MSENIVIVGSSGFLGRSLIFSLKERGLNVAGRDRSQGFDFRILEDCIRATKGADMVVVSAGLITSRKDQAERPAEIFYANTLIDLNVLEACRINGVSKVILVSSILAYASEPEILLKESNLLGAGAPKINGSLGFYHVSKWLGVVAADAFARQYGLKIRIAVLPSFYGPGGKFEDPAPPLIPNLILGLHSAQKKGLKSFFAGSGPGNRIDLLYIEDVCKFLEKIISAFGEGNFLILNAGSGRAYKISDVCDVVARNIGFTGEIVWSDNNESPPVLLDNTLAKNMGWSPKNSLTEGIKKTVDWFLESPHAKH